MHIFLETLSRNSIVWERVVGCEGNARIRNWSTRPEKNPDRIQADRLYTQWVFRLSFRLSFKLNFRLSFRFNFKLNFRADFRLLYSFKLEYREIGNVAPLSLVRLGFLTLVDFQFDQLCRLFQSIEDSTCSVPTADTFFFQGKCLLSICKILFLADLSIEIQSRSTKPSIVQDSFGLRLKTKQNIDL